MTIYEIKRRTSKTAPHFFDRGTMRFFNQTLKDFTVKKQPDGRFLIAASSVGDGKEMGTTVRYFNPTNNKLELTWLDPSPRH